MEPGVVGDELVERRQILVQPEHVRDGRAERVAGLCSNTARDDLETQFATRGREPKGPRAGAGRKRRHKRAFFKAQLVRRQLGHAVGGDRAKEVDRLSLWSPQRYPERLGHRRYMPHGTCTTSALHAIAIQALLCTSVTARREG